MTQMTTKFGCHHMLGEASQDALTLRGGTLRVTPVRGGFGRDYLIGQSGRAAHRLVDLSSFDPVLTIEMTGERQGVISDGIDAMVFRGVEAIILPQGLSDAMQPMLQVYRDLGLELHFGAGARQEPLGVPAE